ncbi:SGNH family hydrolase [Myxococcus sp. AB036A]|uniref:SGNH/GDSL hydrolase family protein n=1 Tax=Myxococcus sp. AB036A TaxID=2562793 RepID=UPI0011466943|nr:SGNH family hydrolase [Myxococcus sp. AB036A]
MRGSIGSTGGCTDGAGIATFRAPMQNRLTRLLVTLFVVSATPAPAASVQEPSPSTVAPTAAPPPAAAPKAPAPAPEVARKHKVLLLGDSLIATGFGEYLQAQLDAHPRIQSARRAKSSTGLARPDFFDWMDVGREEVDRHQPDVVVVILGGNDGQSLQDTQGGKAIHWGHAEWEAAYRQRINDFLTVLSSPGRKIVWLELPATGLKRFEQKLRIIRALQREVISSREDAVHLDTRPFFTDAKGRALSQARVDGFRKPMRLRMADGVHFTVAGGRYFANKVYPEVLGVLGLLQQG